MSDPARPPKLFYGLGAQKAGTTWLHDYLSTHPEVKVPGVFKEQQYWNSVRSPHHGFIRETDALDLVKRRIRQELAILSGGARGLRGRERKLRQRAVRVPRADHRDHIASLMVGYGGEAIVGEITPDYALLDEATFAEMAAMAPDVRFFFILRDPVARALSAARMDSRLDYAHLPTSADVVAAALKEDSGALLARSDYTRTITRLEKAVPRDRIAYFFFETLFQQSEMDRLCAFLGVAPHPADVSKVVFSMKHAGEKGVPKVPEAQMADLKSRLAPVYEFVARKFGDAVPEDWGKG